jgi:hypothetical protein
MNSITQKHRASPSTKSTSRAVGILRPLILGVLLTFISSGSFAGDSSPATIDEVFAGFEKQLEELGKTLEGQYVPIAKNRQTARTYPRPYTDKLIIRRSDAPIWDLVFATYTDDFAKKFDLPDNMRTELPDGMGLLGYAQITHGSLAYCDIFFAIEKQLAPQTPPVNFLAPYYAQQNFVPYSKKAKYPPFSQYMSRQNVHLVQTNSQDEYVKTYWSSLNRFSDETYEGYYLYSIQSTVCAPILENENKAEIWVKKNIAQQGNETPTNSPEAYLHFVLPMKVVSMMEKFRRYATTNIKELYREEK